MKLDMNKYDALNKDEIIEILDTCKNAHSIDMILNKINEIALEKYDRGFNDGYDTGNADGWCECYDQMNEED
jgi:hypothetical protein